MSNILRNTVATGALVMAANGAFACNQYSLTPCTQPTQPSQTINFTSGNENNLTAAPVASATANPTQIANPVANATASPTLIANPVSGSYSNSGSYSEGGQASLNADITNTNKATSDSSAVIENGAIQNSTVYAPVTNYKEAKQATPLGSTNIVETQIIDQCLIAGDSRTYSLGLSAVGAGAFQFGIGTKKLDRNSQEYKECVARNERNGRRGAMYSSGGLERYTVLKEWETEDQDGLGVAMNAARVEVKKAPENQDPFLTGLRTSFTVVNVAAPRVVDTPAPATATPAASVSSERVPCTGVAYIENGKLKCDRDYLPK
ncbi:MAG TPA: hypothetical protein PKI93_01890 [Alphaproteobacteria bacterium]|nr:hypothetical protein [Alphaproteobacteria bacterium]HNS45388.1 hypothetical protein [Alphaproteobacteria bacterium]